MKEGTENFPLLRPFGALRKDNSFAYYSHSVAHKSFFFDKVILLLEKFLKEIRVVEGDKASVKGVEDQYPGGGRNIPMSFG